ncbi:MAG: HIT family protein [Clostridiales bacterium]
MDCIFCNIIERKAKAEIIFENEKIISFLDINPIHLGHILVVPKMHCIDFLSIPEEYLNPLIHVTKIVTDAMVKSLKPDGYNLFSNNGNAAGQSIYHFHMHITPRYFNDEIKFKLSLKQYRETEMKDFAEKIRREVRS